MHTQKLFDLTGKTALITGGSRGLGLQMARALGDMGATVTITARKADELKAAAAQLAKQGTKAFTVTHDLSQLDTIPDMVTTVLGHCGHIDILVNNAGTTWGAAAEDHPAAAWHKVLNLNLNGTFFLTQEVGKRCMIPARAGKIINIASVAGLSGNPPGMKTIAYNTSKGALVNFTRALAAEWGAFNINVNAICPGFFPSKMSQGLLDSLGPIILAMTPLQRMGGEEDLQGVITFLASEASRHITGQYLVVDGGASLA